MRPLILKTLEIFDGKTRKKFDSEEAHKAFLAILQTNSLKRVKILFVYDVDG